MTSEPATPSPAPNGRPATSYVVCRGRRRPRRTLATSWAWLTLRVTDLTATGYWGRPYLPDTVRHRSVATQQVVPATTALRALKRSMSPAVGSRRGSSDPR